MTDQINYAELEKLWSNCVVSDCGHPRAKIWRDENGVFHIHCGKCGIYGLTSEEGARSLGWIE